MVCVNNYQLQHFKLDEEKHTCVMLQVHKATTNEVVMLHFDLYKF